MSIIFVCLRHMETIVILQRVKIVVHILENDKITYLGLTWVIYLKIYTYKIDIGKKNQM